MVPSATTSCVEVTEVEDALAICRDEEESGTTGQSFAMGMENHHSHYGKSQASVMR